MFLMIFHYLIITIFIIASAIVYLITSVLSDKYSRMVFLNISLMLGIVLWMLLAFGFTKLAILLSPLFFSTPIARAAMIDNHEHVSVKNLMCITYICVFLPWSFYSYFSSALSNTFIHIIFLVAIIACLIFVHKHISVKNKAIPKSLIRNRRTWIYFVLAFFLVQIVFFLLFGKLEHIEQHAKIFDFMNIGLLLGSVLCIFLTGKHEDLIFLCYVFFLIMAINAFVAYLFWGQGDLLKIFLGEISVVGGVLLPLVTEKAVLILGPNKRGIACGLVEIVSSVASIIALFGVGLFIKGYIGIILTVLVLVVIICVLQWIHNHYSKQRENPGVG